MKKKRVIIGLVLGLVLILVVTASCIYYRLYITDKIILHSSQIDKSYIDYKGNIILLTKKEEQTLLNELLKLSNDYETKFEPILTCGNMKNYRRIDGPGERCLLAFFFDPAQLSKTCNIDKRAGHIYYIGYVPNDNSDCNILLAGLKENNFSADGSGMCYAYGNWPKKKDKTAFDNFDKRIYDIIKNAGF